MRRKVMRLLLLVITHTAVAFAVWLGCGIHTARHWSEPQCSRGHPMADESYYIGRAIRQQWRLKEYLYQHLSQYGTWPRHWGDFFHQGDSSTPRPSWLDSITWNFTNSVTAVYEAVRGDPNGVLDDGGRRGIKFIWYSEPGICDTPRLRELEWHANYDIIDMLKAFVADGGVLSEPQ